MNWECKNGHTWVSTVFNIKNMDSWCPYCLNKSEQKCRELFEQITGKKFPKIRPKWLINDRGNQMELDGYCEELKIAFEYQGKQHYEIVEFFKQTEDELKQAALAIVAASRSEEGCLNYDFHQSLEDSTIFTWHETWANKSALDAHFAMPLCR